MKVKQDNRRDKKKKGSKPPKPHQSNPERIGSPPKMKCKQRNRGLKTFFPVFVSKV